MLWKLWLGYGNKMAVDAGGVTAALPRSLRKTGSWVVSPCRGGTPLTRSGGISQKRCQIRGEKVHTFAPGILCACRADTHWRRDRRMCGTLFPTACYVELSGNSWKDSFPTRPFRIASAPPLHPTWINCYIQSQTPGNGKGLFAWSQTHRKEKRFISGGAAPARVTAAPWVS